MPLEEGHPLRTRMIPGYLFSVPIISKDGFWPSLLKPESIHLWDEDMEAGIRLYYCGMKAGCSGLSAALGLGLRDGANTKPKNFLMACHQ